MNKSFLRRMEMLDSSLRKRIRRWTIETLLNTVNNRLEELGIPPISRRTLYADLKAMREEFNAPIERYRYTGQICFRYSEPDFSIFSPQLDAGDFETLYETLQLLENIAAPDLTRRLRMVLERLDQNGIFACDPEGALIAQ